MTVQLTTNNTPTTRVPLANVLVTWSTTNPGGAVTPNSTLTDAQGRATAEWRLGSAAGVQTLTASTLGFPGADPNSVFSVNVIATAEIPGTRTLRVVSGDRQTGISSRLLLHPLVVEYVAIDMVTGVATPVANAVLDFAASDGGALDPSRVTTDANGRATTRWTLGAAVKEQSVRVTTSPPSAAELTLTATAQPAELLLQDDFATGAQWLPVVSRNDQNAWTQTAQNRATGGNPDGFRRMVHTLTTNTAPDFSTLLVQHRYTGATYDPSTQGAIVSIDFSQDQQSVGAVYGSFLIVQNGVAYEAVFPNGSVFEGPWHRVALNALQPANFSPAPGPDFSATGGPMVFGFVRGNTARFAPATTTHDVDNWRVLIRR